MAKGVFLLLLLIFVLPFNVFSQTEVAPQPEGKTPLTVVDIRVVGNVQVPTEQILEMVSTKIGDILDENKLKSDVQSIYDLGYFSDVKEKTEVVPQGARVIFIVTENPIVKSIQIQGNSLVSTATIESLMKTKPGKILNSRTLYGDVLAINQYYASLGYTDPTNHVVNLSWSKDGVVSLQIQEGIVIKAIEINGNSVYTTAQIRSLIHSKVGQIFNRKKMEEDLGRIAELYKEDGYILSGLKGNIEPDGTVVVDITETVVESMRIEGNQKTKPYVIYRYIHTKIGSVLNKNEIQKDLRRLKNTGYFSDVDVEPEEGTAPGKVALVWKVKEQRSGTASVGIGYSGTAGGFQGGLTGQITLSENNIAGTGQGASISWQRGLYVSEIALSYSNPFIDRAEDSVAISYFNTSYFNLNQNTLNTQATLFGGLVNPYLLQLGQFSEHQSGGTITVGRPIFDEDTRIYLTGEHEVVSANSTAFAFSALLLPYSQGTVNSGGIGVVRDKRDDDYNTTRGSFYSVSYTKAGTPFGGTFDFSQYQEDVREYFPLASGFTLAFRILTAWDTGGVPLTNWFVLGGPDTLRGYTLDSFIGTRMVLGQAEMRFPLGKQKLFSGALFYDTGNVWQPTQVVQLGKLLHDYGIGIRMNLPSLGLGVIRLDYVLGSSQGGSRIVIGIGQTF
jgi:outer membrane protein insertion porin family